MKCPKCDKTIVGPHVFRCIGPGDENKYVALIHNFPELTKDGLEKEYVQNSMSLPKLKKKYGINYNDTTFLLDFYGIKRRNHSEARLLVTDEIRETSFKKWGYINSSQVEEVKEKKRQTYLKNYGVDNIRKYKPFYDYVKEVVLEKYGKTLGELQSELSKKRWSDKSDEDKRSWLEASLFSHRPEKVSNLEKRVGKCLSEINIEFETQLKINAKFYDYKIFNNLIIEVNGDYWHANPKIYKPDDELKMGRNGKVTAKDKWSQDAIKKELAESKGYRIIYLWESDITKLSDEDLCKYILLEINNELCKDKEDYEI